ncbi:MAG: hypothetical protein KJO31_06595 [Gammaproteobacteria bacterium]|nr:hypothetical protein [Gammaproteobacteria bacterium]
MLVMFVPVVAYYALVIVGITRLQLWEMNTWPTIRGLRPHHGFVIGTATGLLTYLSLRLMPVGSGGVAGIVTAAFVVGSVFGFWNWWYETYAIKSGFISIYTRRRAEGASAEEAVTDYAPILFGSMGACHGAMVKTAENLLLVSHSPATFWFVAAGGGLALMIIPAALYGIVHRIRYGESGFRSYRAEIKTPQTHSRT